MGKIMSEIQKLKIGDIATIYAGGTPSRVNKEFWGGSIPWVKTTHIQNCIINEQDIDEKITDIGLRSSSAKMVPKGSILMAMIGQGKTRGQVAILNVDAAINQNSVAILLDDHIDRDYVWHQLLFRYKQIRNISNSSGQQNLNATIIKKITLPFPDYKQQQFIGKILCKWDEAIEKTTKLIEIKNKRFECIRDHLLRKISKKTETRYRPIGNLLDYEQPTKYIVKSTKYNENGSIAVLTANKSFVLGYTDEEDGIFDKFPAIIFDDFTTDIKYADFPFKVKSSAIKILIPKSKEIDLEYMFAAMSKIKIVLGGHKRYWISEYQFLSIPIPPLPQQKQIAKTLNIAKKEITILEGILEKYKNQKKGLMQKLLTGKIRVNNINSIN